MSREVLEYYSGAQAQIYFGDILIDDCQSIQFEAATNRTPIYGYASHKFDTILEGNILISGAFSINFVHQNYLIAVFRNLLKPDSGTIMPPRRTADRFEDQTEFQQKVAIQQAKNLTNERYAQFHQTVEWERARDGETELTDLGIISRFYETPMFDIFIALGNKPLGGLLSLSRSDENSFERGAVRKISNAVITSTGQMIGASGEPILETYRFVARDIA